MSHTSLWISPDLDSLKRICKKKKFIWLRIAAKHQVQNIKEKKLEALEISIFIAFIIN